MDMNEFLKCKIHTDVGKFQINSTNNNVKVTSRKIKFIFQKQVVFSHFPSYPQANWALLVLIPMWVGLYTF